MSNNHAQPGQDKVNTFSITPALIKADLKSADVLYNEFKEDNDNNMLRMSAFHAVQAIEKVLKLKLYMLNPTAYFTLRRDHNFSLIIQKLEESGSDYFRMYPKIKEDFSFLSHCNSLRYGEEFVNETETIDIIKLAKDTCGYILDNNKETYIAKRFETDNPELIKVRDLFIKNMTEEPRFVETANGRVPSQAGFEIQDIKKDGGAFCLTVAMLANSMVNNCAPGKGDICRFYSQKNKIYTEAEWRKLQKNRAAKRNKSMTDDD